MYTISAASPLHCWTWRRMHAQANRNKQAVEDNTDLSCLICLTCRDMDKRAENAASCDWRCRARMCGTTSQAVLWQSTARCGFIHCQPCPVSTEAAIELACWYTSQLMHGGCAGISLTLIQTNSKIVYVYWAIMNLSMSKLWSCIKAVSTQQKATCLSCHLSIFGSCSVCIMLREEKLVDETVARKLQDIQAIDKDAEQPIGWNRSYVFQG